MIKEYIKDAYPHGIREGAYEEGSLTNKYDEVRGYLFDLLSAEITSNAKQLLITTSDEVGILEWENFLHLNGLGLSLEERRSVLLSTVFGRNTTLAVLKLVVYSIVGGDSSSVEFYETWTDGVSTGDDLFTYEVRINKDLVTNVFKPEILEATINNLQPQHCTVAIVATDYPTFSWSAEGSPEVDSYEWVSEDLLYAGAKWS